MKKDELEFLNQAFDQIEDQNFSANLIVWSIVLFLSLMLIGGIWLFINEILK